MSGSIPLTAGPLDNDLARRVELVVYGAGTIDGGKSV